MNLDHVIRLGRADLVLNKREFSRAKKAGISSPALFRPRLSLRNGNIFRLWEINARDSTLTGYYLLFRIEDVCSHLGEISGFVAALSQGQPAYDRRVDGMTTAVLSKIGH